MRIATGVCICWVTSTCNGRAASILQLKRSLTVSAHRAKQQEEVQSTAVDLAGQKRVIHTKGTYSLAEFMFAMPLSALYKHRWSDLLCLQSLPFVRSSPQCFVSQLLVTQHGLLCPQPAVDHPAQKSSIHGRADDHRMAVVKLERRLRVGMSMLTSGPLRPSKKRCAPVGMSVTTSASPSHAPKASRWAKFRQNLNAAGVVGFFKAVLLEPSEAIPHVRVQTIQSVDFERLQQGGVKAVVFDKDNTVTMPYEEQIHEPLATAFAACVAAFGSENVAVLSNSAGLEQFDPDGALARHLAVQLGVPVIKHKHKKPRGTVEEIERHFGSRFSADEVLFVGDRALTDVVFGNRLGMLTLAVAPLDVTKDPLSVRLARRIEYILFVVQVKWRGLTAPKHALMEILRGAVRD